MLVVKRQAGERRKEVGDTGLLLDNIIILIIFKLFHICQLRLFFSHLKYKLNVIRI